MPPIDTILTPSPPTSSDLSAAVRVVGALAEVVPCATCGAPTAMTGTKRCDACWEVERRLANYLLQGGKAASAFVAATLERAYSRMFGCTPGCWTPVYCAHCRRPWPPRGRSVAAEMAGCYCTCPDTPSSPQHLFGEHDPDRFFFDRSGWSEHVRECERCKEESQTT